MQKISGLVENILRKIYKRHGVVFSEIMVNWPKIIGIKYSAVARPVRISQYRDGEYKLQLLFVEVDSASCSMELSYQQNVVLERLAMYFGYRAIDKIKFIVRPQISKNNQG